MALHWNNALAAPRAHRNMPPNVTPFTLPPAAGADPDPRHCRDWVFHPTVQQLGNPNDPCQGPCSTDVHPRPNARPPPPLAANWTGLPVDWYRRIDCPDPSHVVPFMSCGFCREHTVGQPWYTHILNNVTSVPPPRAMPAVAARPGIAAVPAVAATVQRLQGHLAWRRFLTHLCRECEEDEQILWVARKTARPPTQAANMQFNPQFRCGDLGFPNSTCYCLGQLEGPAGQQYCIRCRHYRACRRHDRQLRFRQQGDWWLRRIEAVPGGPDGAVRMLTPRAIKGRAQRATRRGINRACRCGREVVFKRDWTPSVFLCMACDGVTHTGPYAAANAWPGIAPRVAQVYRTTRASTARLANLLQRTPYPLRRR